MKQGTLTSYDSGVAFIQAAIVQETQVDTSTPGKLMREIILARPSDDYAGLVLAKTNPDGTTEYKGFVLDDTQASLALADLVAAEAGGVPYPSPMEDLGKFLRTGPDASVFELPPAGRLYGAPAGADFNYLADCQDNPYNSRRSNIGGHIDRLLDAGAKAVFVDFRESTNPTGIVYVANTDADSVTPFGGSFDLSGETASFVLLTDATPIAPIGGQVGIFI